MNQTIIENLLRFYPAHWRIWQARKEVINGAYSAEAGLGRGYLRTDRAAILMVMLDKHYSMLQVVGAWIDQELQPEDRPLLLDVWRRCDWRMITRKNGGTLWANQERWNQMIAGLIQYVGTACAAAGTVSANGRRIKGGER